MSCSQKCAKFVNRWGPATKLQSYVIYLIMTSTTQGIKLWENHGCVLLGTELARGIFNYSQKRTLTWNCLTVPCSAVLAFGECLGHILFAKRFDIFLVCSINPSSSESSTWWTSSSLCRSVLAYWPVFCRKLSLPSGIHSKKKLFSMLALPKTDRWQYHQAVRSKTFTSPGLRHNTCMISGQGSSNHRFASALLARS